jgi:hypothetical protein
LCSDDRRHWSTTLLDAGEACGGYYTCEARATGVGDSMYGTESNRDDLNRHETPVRQIDHKLLLYTTKTPLIICLREQAGNGRPVPVADSRCCKNDL